MEYDLWKNEAPFEYKKKLIQDFIENTLNYARDHVHMRHNEMANMDPTMSKEKYFRLLQWISYIEFQEHTLKELKTDKLDRFL